MRYQKFRIKIASSHSDLLSDALCEQGFEGVEIEDKIPLTEAELAAMFVDIPEMPAEDDGLAYVSVFLPMTPEGKLVFGEDPALDPGTVAGGLGSGREAGKAAVTITKEEALSRIRAALMEMTFYGAAETEMAAAAEAIEISCTEDADWANNWKDFFHAFQVGDLLIEPSWEAGSEDTSAKRKLIIDPGAAFGTGSHETTRLCIEALQQLYGGGKGSDVVLDIGTGSGILGIVALLYGAKYIVGTDLDPQAISASPENMERNGFGKERFQMLQGNVITDAAFREELLSLGKEKAAGDFAGFPIVTANILAEVLIALSGVVRSLMAPGGILISSGILKEKAEEVCKAYEAAGLTIAETGELGDWALVVAKN